MDRVKKREGEGEGEEGNKKKKISWFDKENRNSTLLARVAKSL